MNYRSGSLLLVCLLFTLAVTTCGQDLEKGVIHVKLKESYSTGISMTTLRQGHFGLQEVDRAGEAVGVNSVRRMFRDAGKYEAAHRTFGLHLWYEITFDAQTPVATAITRYRTLPEVDVVEGMQGYHAVKPREEKYPAQRAQQLAGPANDPFFNQQWHYHNTGQSGGTPGADVSLLQAWTIQTGDPRVIVAVIDGGIDILHPDLTPSLWVNAGEIAGNDLDDDRNGYVDDIHGYGFDDDTGTIYADDHGTHVAGTIAAVTNNGVGVAGVAGGSGAGNGVRLMSCATFGNFDVGGFADAMVYAADNGAVISQNSWGGGSSAIEAAIHYFIARGIRQYRSKFRRQYPDRSDGRWHRDLCERQ